MAVRKQKPTLQLALYGNFRRGKTLSKWLNYKKKLSTTLSKKEYFMYNGLGGIPKLYDVPDVGNQIHLEIWEVYDKDLEEFLATFRLELKKIETINKEEVWCPFQKDNDVDLVLIDKGMANGK